MDLPPIKIIHTDGCRVVDVASPADHSLIVAIAVYIAEANLIHRTGWIIKVTNRFPAVLLLMDKHDIDASAIALFLVKSNSILLPHAYQAMHNNGRTIFPPTGIFEGQASARRFFQFIVDLCTLPCGTRRTH